MFSGLTGNHKQQQPAPSGDGKKDDDASLDKVLPDQASKLEFVLLVMQCTDRIRADIEAVFDPAITSSAPVTPHGPPSPWEDHKDAANDKPPSYGQATKDHGRKNDDYLRRKRELGSLQMKELQQDVVKAFSGWRVRVLKRVGEVLKVKADAAKAEKTRRDALGPQSYFQGQATQDQSNTPGDDLINLDEEDPLAASKQHAKHQYPKIPTSLVSLGEDERKLLLNSSLLLLLSLEHYSAYSRLLLLFLATSLNLPTLMITEQEDKVAEGLLKGAKAQMDAEASRKRENNKSASERAWKVGLATVAGAAVIGLTGGLAAPLLAGAMGTVLGGIGLGGTAIAGLLGALAGNFVVIGTLFGAYGGSMTGKMMDKYAKEVEDFRFIPLRKIEDDQHRLRVAIGISGWLEKTDDRYIPWLVLGDRVESFCLQWELDVLLKLGSSLLSTFKELAVRYAAVEIIKRTIFAGLMVALWPLGLLRIGQMLSNSFSVAQVRADKAGEVMADALIHKAQGERPVTLIGYSLGARVIYSCLQALAKRKAFGLVESVYLFGLPASAESQNWRPIRAVVADRVVNVYSRNDYILGLVYRTSSITPDVAGLQPIDEVSGIENVDVSDIVNGHLKYQYTTGAILEKVGYETIDHDQLEKQRLAVDKLDEEEERLKREAKAKQDAKAGSGTTKDDDGSWGDELLGGDGARDARELNNEEIEQRLKELKLKEEKDAKNEISPPLPQRPDHPSGTNANPALEEPAPGLPPRPSTGSNKQTFEASRNDKSTPQPPQTKKMTNVAEDEELPPWKQPEELSASKVSNEPMQTLNPDAVVTEDEDDFKGHRIAMLDGE